MTYLIVDYAYIIMCNIRNKVEAGLAVHLNTRVKRTLTPQHGLIMLALRATATA